MYAVRYSLSIEQQRLEAERRQKYFESLSPEEQQAYIQEQRAMQARRDQAAAIYFAGGGIINVRRIVKRTSTSRITIRGYSCVPYGGRCEPLWVGIVTQPRRLG